MNAVSSMAPVTAETLTLGQCIQALDRVVARSEDALRSVGAEAATSIPAASLASSAEGWRQAFNAILAIDIGRIFKAAALKLSAELPKVEAEADGSMSIVLLPFVIASSHHPRIMATCDPVVVPLNFDVELSLEIEGAQLRWESGRFVGASTGKTKGVARISLLNAKPPLELGSPSFTLPGELAFAEPIAAEVSA